MVRDMDERSDMRSSAGATTGTVFPLLADPGGYVACRWNLAEDEAKRGYWIGLFREHFDKLLATGREDEKDRGVGEAELDRREAGARRRLRAYLDLAEADPAGAGEGGRLTILDLCLERERTLREAGYADPYRLAKRRANEESLPHLPGLLDELDAMDVRPRQEALLKGVLAGNIFDLGATKTVDMFDQGKIDFSRTRENLKPRPWFVDDVEAWTAGVVAGDGSVPFASACLFVDNAGPDVVLGMIPLARDLLMRGSRVVMTANSEPSLNDVTCDDLDELLARVATTDREVAAALGEGRLMTVASGNVAPLIDLSRVSAELAEVVERERPGLVVIEGMGRAVESNFEAELSVATLKIAMVKDEGVADTLGAELFDLVCRFEGEGEEVKR